MNVNPAIVWPVFGVLAVILLLMNKSVRRWLGRLFAAEDAPRPSHGGAVSEGGRLVVGDGFVLDRVDELIGEVRRLCNELPKPVEAELDCTVPDTHDSYHARLDSFRELHAHVKAHGDEEAQKALETLLPLITKDQPETNEG